MFPNKLRLLAPFLLTVGAGIHVPDPALAQCEIAKLKGSDTSAGDQLGTAVVVSGDTAIVGAREDDHGATDTGSAYIFQRNEGGANNWGEVRKLTADDATAGDRFGSSVSVCGDIVIVGAPDDDDCGEASGAAYVFRRDEGGVNNWGQVKKLIASDCAAGDRFGQAVSCSGDTAIVGAPQDDDAGSNSGSAYIFQQDQGGLGNWGEVKKLTANDAAAGDWFGWTGGVSISGDTAIVGAQADDDNGNDTGSAYIFERDEGGPDNWGEVRKLTASDPESGDNFGRSVSISGDIAIVGASGSDDAGMRSGSAYIFQRNEGGANNWGEVRKLTASDAAADDFFGDCVCISSETAMVGAYRCPNDPVCDTGSAYIFGRNDGGPDNWGEVMKLTACDAATGHRFAYSVSVSGDTAIAGACGDGDLGGDAGSAYVFALDEDCPCPAIPTVSAWGLTVMSLLVVTAGTLVYTGRRLSHVAG